MSPEQAAGDPVDERTAHRQTCLPVQERQY
jgi:hypothetical protein